MEIDSFTQQVTSPILTPTGPRIHGLNMSNLIDQIVKDMIQMGSIFPSPESMKNIACIGHEINKIGKKQVFMCPTQNC